jgi:hypothetical protein
MIYQVQTPLIHKETHCLAFFFLYNNHIAFSRYTPSFGFSFPLSPYSRGRSKGSSSNNTPEKTRNINKESTSPSFAGGVWCVCVWWGMGSCLVAERE